LVRAAAEDASTRYIASIPIGGEKPGGIVKLLALESVFAKRVGGHGLEYTRDHCGKDGGL
jgi:hypothetical protein